MRTHPPTPPMTAARSGVGRATGFEPASRDQLVAERQARLTGADDDGVDALRHGSQSLRLLATEWIGRPPTHVSSTAIALSSLTGRAIGSAARMARSASLRGSRDPT